MKILNNKLALAVALTASALAQAAPVHVDQGYDGYRRAVLGDTTIAAPSFISPSGLELVPGAYARYLIANGESPAQAIETARRIGEPISYRSAVANPPDRQLTAAQAYARHLGTDSDGDSLQASGRSAE